LKILEDQGYIAKRYDKSYKLRGKPAAYYLLPYGARAVLSAENINTASPLFVVHLYKAKHVSEDFIQHCLNIVNVFLALHELYGNRLTFFSKIDLKSQELEDLPQPLPDAYFYIESAEERKEYFLNIFADSQPFFVLVRRIKKYLEYAGSSERPATTLPTVLMIVENSSIHKRLRKRLTKEVRSSYEEVEFATTILGNLFTSNSLGKVWLPIDETLDSFEDRKAVRLEDL